MNIVLLGPQGSGKGTQARLLTEKYGFTRIETGEILREIAQTDHPWGKRIRDMQNRGVLVSDKILSAVLKEALAKPDPRGRLFDGTPRNHAQYQLIQTILAGKGEQIDLVIYIGIPEEETIRRLTARRTCDRCGKIYNLITDPPPEANLCSCGGELKQREDDFPEAISKRLEAFRRSTTRVIAAAEHDGILVRIDGQQPIEKIHSEIVRIMESLPAEGKT